MKFVTYLKFFFLCNIFLSCFSYSNTIIISDIDDTIRQTNVLNKIKAAKSLFLEAPAFEALQVIFGQFKSFFSNTEMNFYYLSASPECFVPHVEWIRKKNLPPGGVFQRACDEKWLKPGYTLRYKFNKIAEILKSYNSLKRVILFGDNAEYDPLVYQMIKQEFSSHEVQIFIRDIRVEATLVDRQLPVKKFADVNYFLTENDLLEYSIFDILSENQKDKIKMDFLAGKLYPKYLYKNLAKRYEKELGYNNHDAEKLAKAALINTRRY